MFINEVCLTLIVLGSMSFGCCVGMVVMAMCKVSATNRIESEDESP